MKKNNDKYFKPGIIVAATVLYSSYGYCQQFALEFDKPYVAYVGVPNPVHAVSNLVNCKDIVLKVNAGKLEGAGCNYMYYPDKPGKVIFSGYAKLPRGLKKTCEIQVRIKLLPKPTVVIAGRASGNISRAALLAAGGPGIEMPYFDYDLRPLITKCTLVVRCGVDGETLFERTFENSTGVIFDDETVGLFKNIEQGDILLLKNIMTTHPVSPECSDTKFIVVR